MEFNERLKYLIDNVKVNNKKVSSYRIGKDTPISRVSFENYMEGRQLPTIDKAIIIAQYFNISISWLLLEDGDIQIASLDKSDKLSAYLSKEVEKLKEENRELLKEVGGLENQLKEIKKRVPVENDVKCAIASGSDLEK